MHLPTGSMGIAGFTHELQTMSKESGRHPVCRWPFLRAKHNRRFSASKTASLLEIFVWELPQWEACRKQHAGTICLFWIHGTITSSVLTSTIGHHADSAMGSWQVKDHLMPNLTTLDIRKLCYGHTHTDRRPRYTLLPPRGMQPPPLCHPPWGLAPCPHLPVHYHPHLPYYHIWSTLTPLYLFHPPIYTTSKACPLFFDHS